MGELFDTIHELHFQPHVGAAVDFVLKALETVAPSRVVLVHLMEARGREVVVFRAPGASSKVIGHRTATRQPLFARVLGSEQPVHVRRPGTEPGFLGERWLKAGVEPREALCAALFHEGRAHGVLELADPDDGTPFRETEINAVDYLARQLGEYLADRPPAV